MGFALVFRSTVTDLFRRNAEVQVQPCKSNLTVVIFQLLAIKILLARRLLTLSAWVIQLVLPNCIYATSYLKNFATFFTGIVRTVVQLVAQEWNFVFCTSVVQFGFAR